MMIGREPVIAQKFIPAVSKGDKRVLLIDDVLATGGTAAAATRLVEKLGGEVVGSTFLIELSFIPGRKKLTGQAIASAIRY